MQGLINESKRSSLSAIKRFSLGGSYTEIRFKDFARAVVDQYRGFAEWRAEKSARRMRCMMVHIFESDILKAIA